MVRVGVVRLEGHAQFSYSGTCVKTIKLPVSSWCMCMRGRFSDTSLARQTHFCKRGKGLVNLVYKPCPTRMQLAG